MSKTMFSKKQLKFLKAKLKRINLLYGSVRSGKTYISLLKWALWVGQQPILQEFLMVGRTLTTLKRNCLVLLEHLIGDNITYSISQKKAIIFGRTVWLEGANDERSESKIRGMTLKGVYIDELTLIPEEFYLMALSRLSEKGAVLLATTNPDHPKHYVNLEIIQNGEIDKQVVKFLLDDNIFLDSDYKKNLKKEYTGVFYRRFILGEFVNAEGVIFESFANDPTPHIISADKLKKKDKFGRETPLCFRWCDVGFDIGGNGSAYALTCTAEGIDGNYYVLKSEKKQAEELTMSDIEKFVVSFCQYVEKKYNCKIDGINSDHIAVIINSINDNTSYRADLTYKPPLEDRVFAYTKMLAKGNLFFLDGECDDLIDELQNLVFDNKSDRTIPLDDGTMQIDTYDSFTYSLASNWNYLDI
jgi:PBSX family phage terminase large subunit